jgi:hypothetical protein
MSWTLKWTRQEPFRVPGTGSGENSLTTKKRIVVPNSHLLSHDPGPDQDQHDQEQADGKGDGQDADH